MEHSAKPVVTLHAPGRERDHVGRLAGSALFQTSVRPGVVVVLDELAQHPLQMASPTRPDLTGREPVKVGIRPQPPLGVDPVTARPAEPGYASLRSSVIAHPYPLNPGANSP